MSEEAALYEKAKGLFEDTEHNEYFVLLTRTRLAYGKLVNSLKNPFKIILLYGRPGTGKSYLLQRFFFDHKDRFSMFLYKNPTFSGEDRLIEIYESIWQERPAAKDLHTLIAAFKAKTQEPIYILLDEAQLYSDDRLEWIRTLSNEEVFRFIIVVHKVDQEDLLAKEHFKTRTFETIEIGSIDLAEVSRFVETKLLLGELPEFYDRFKRRNFERIYQLTRGNLRDINRLMHRFFDLLSEMAQKKPHRIPSRFSNRLLEMAALDLGMLNG
ncbi:MAG: AAA family ATPase [Campylobacterales bacterium]